MIMLIPKRIVTKINFPYMVHCHALFREKKRMNHQKNAVYDVGLI